MLDALTFTKTPKVASLLFSDALWKVNTFEKKLYLTFDDGPIPEVTPWVLEELKKYNALATFFCIGKNVTANPEIFQQILEEGHSVGNHTYDHLNGWQTENNTYFENVEKCSKELEVGSSEFTTTRNPQLFRPPYGKLTPSQYSTLKSQYKIVMWDVLSFDFDVSIEKEDVLRNVIDNAETGSVVLFHDSLKAQKKVKYALPQVLEYFSKKGFTFDKL
jgi:peptidoglycan/xylan/chitin deacetylase (PgdA/CDA1 family)